ncbi:MAG: hypothetical protein ACN2B6_12130 [Rickettsiales bacterium]
MKTTAKKFSRSPNEIYRAADKGETVVINHDHYKDRVFELTARARNPLNIDTSEWEEKGRKAGQAGRAALLESINMDLKL